MAFSPVTTSHPAPPRRISPITSPSSCASHHGLAAGGGARRQMPQAGSGFCAHHPFCELWSGTDSRILSLTLARFQEAPPSLTPPTVRCQPRVVCWGVGGRKHVAKSHPPWSLDSPAGRGTKLATPPESAAQLAHPSTYLGRSQGRTCSPSLKRLPAAERTLAARKLGRDLSWKVGHTWWRPQRTQHY